MTALHICAEFNSTRCAHILLDAGADVNARADQDENGLGGQTPIFHAVNSIFNYCRPVMEILVNAGADLDTRVRSLLWGDSMNWETVVYDVTPISYAQCGLYRQFHRREDDVYSNIAYLHRKRFDTRATDSERAQQVSRSRALAYRRLGTCLTRTPYETFPVERHRPSWSNAWPCEPQAGEASECRALTATPRGKYFTLKVVGDVRRWSSEPSFGF